VNILINFRYISTIDLSEGSISDAIDSEEIDLLVDNFKEIVTEYKKHHVNSEDFLINDKLHSNVKNVIRMTALEQIKNFNKCKDYLCYLWLDEICSICINGTKAIPLEDINTYVNFEDLKHTIQKSIFELVEKDPTINPNNYSDVFFVVYLDIIEKGIPSFFVNSDWYK
jgi:hypothetical protein